jgi:acyl-CoA thioester hydrolase
MAEEYNVDAVVGEATVRYRAPLQFDDEFEVAIEVGRLGDTSLTLELGVERSGETCAEGEIRYVFIDPDAGGKTSVPAPLRDALAPYAPG